MPTFPLVVRNRITVIKSFEKTIPVVLNNDYSHKDVKFSLFSSFRQDHLAFIKIDVVSRDLMTFDHVTGGARRCGVAHSRGLCSMGGCPPGCTGLP